MELLPSSFDMADAFVAVRPPTFSGKPEQDVDAFINVFDRFIQYKEQVETNKKLNLSTGRTVQGHRGGLVWADDRKDAMTKLRAAFASCYQAPEVLKINVRPKYSLASRLPTRLYCRRLCTAHAEAR